jgi:hypothetical protein
LFEHVIKIAKDKGIFGVKLYVLEKNEIAKNIYLHFGMSPVKCKIYECDVVYLMHHPDPFGPEPLENRFKRALGIIDRYQPQKEREKLPSELELELEGKFLKKIIREN